MKKILLLFWFVGFSVVGSNQKELYEASMELVKEGKNTEAMEMWTTLSKDFDNSNAQLFLGLSYLDGKFVKKDDELAFYWLDRAASKNNVYAQHTLSQFYMFGIVVDKNIDKAIFLLEQAASKKYKESFYMLGIIYETNKFKKRDIDKALFYFKESAKLNDEKAKERLIKYGINVST